MRGVVDRAPADRINQVGRGISGDRVVFVALTYVWVVRPTPLPLDVELVVVVWVLGRMYPITLLKAGYLEVTERWDDTPFPDGRGTFVPTDQVRRVEVPESIRRLYNFADQNGK